MQLRSLLLGGALGLAALPLAAGLPSEARTALARQAVGSSPSRVSNRGALPSAAARPASHFDLGVAYLRQKKYAAAEREFRRAIAAHDHTALAYADLAGAAWELGDFVTAFRSYKQAASMEPRNAAFQYGTAFEALYAGDYHASITYATAFIKLQPRAYKGYHLRFLAESRLYEPKAEVADAAIEVRLEPNNPTAHNDYGIGLTNDKQYAKALVELTRAIKMDPKNFQFYVNRAQTEEQDKLFRPALQDLQTARALTHDPSIRRQLDAAIKFLQKQIKH